MKSKGALLKDNEIWIWVNGIVRCLDKLYLTLERPAEVNLTATK